MLVKGATGQSWGPIRLPGYHMTPDYFLQSLVMIPFLVYHVNEADDVPGKCPLIYQCPMMSMCNIVVEIIFYEYNPCISHHVWANVIIQLALLFLSDNLQNIAYHLEVKLLFTRGQYWPSGIVVACVRPSVSPSVRPQVCPRDNSSPVQARITKFGS